MFQPPIHFVAETTTDRSMCGGPVRWFSMPCDTFLVYLAHGAGSGRHAGFADRQGVATICASGEFLAEDSAIAFGLHSIDAVDGVNLEGPDQ